MQIEKCDRTITQGSQTVLDYKEILQALQTNVKNPAKIVAWFNHCVVFGRYDNGKITWAKDFVFAEDQFLELRVFNQTEEFWQRGIKWRYIIDTVNATGQVEYVDSFSRLWGEHDPNEGISADGFVTLTDTGRQLKLLVPADSNGKDYELFVRSYIGYNSLAGQAGYEMYRYLDIKLSSKEVTK